MDNLYNRVARRRRRGQSGFTLIELLIVIAVLGILAGIVIFNIAGVSNKGNTAACQTDKGTVQTAIDSYFNDKAVYPVTGGDVASPAAGKTINTTELTSGGYIHTAPTEAFTYTGTTGTITGGGC